MKATAKYFRLLQFLTQYNVVLFCETVSENLNCDHSNESYSEQYFSVVLLIMLYKMALNFESVDEILKCDHSNESY